MYVRLYSSYDIKIILNIHFCRKNGLILLLCTQRCYGRHNDYGKSVNHKWFIDLLHGVISLPDATPYGKYIHIISVARDKPNNLRG